MLKLLSVQVMPELNAIMSSFELCAAVVEVTIIKLSFHGLAHFKSTNNVRKTSFMKALTLDLVLVLWRR